MAELPSSAPHIPLSAAKGLHYHLTSSLHLHFSPLRCVFCGRVCARRESFFFIYIYTCQAKVSNIKSWCPWYQCFKTLEYHNSFIEQQAAFLVPSDFTLLCTGVAIVLASGSVDLDATHFELTGSQFSDMDWKCEFLSFLHQHFQSMLKTKLNVLTLRKEPLPTVIFHEPEAIELCSTTPLTKNRTHAGYKVKSHEPNNP